MVDTRPRLAYSSLQPKQKTEPVPIHFSMEEAEPIPKPLTLKIPPALIFSDDQFFEFCQLNSELRLERTAGGKMIIVMLPAGAETGNQNFGLSAALYNWTHQDKRGVGFDSSAGFILPNGATRSPDASWVLRTRLAHFTAEEKKKFLHICPDFVAELRSSSDRLADLQAKMQEYIENGALLGWLIDPLERKVHIYRPDNQPVILDNPDAVSGDPELPSFVLDLREIWEPGF